MWYLWHSLDPKKDPAANAAVEEACLRDGTHSYFFLWVSPPSIHVGKNQNLWAEINVAECFRHRIGLYRRLSGGGAVYHDAGNLNYSIVTKGEAGLAFHKYLSFLLPFFHHHGLDAELRGKSDLFVNGKKFSGNAEYFTKGRVLHHGTLLYDGDLVRLHRLLTPQSKDYEDRSIRSNPNDTVNLRPLLPHLPTIDRFASALLAYMKDYLGEATLLAQPPDEIKQSSIKYRDHFGSIDWLVGRSPDYRLKRTIRGKAGVWEFQAEVKKGCLNEYQLKHWSSSQSLPRKISLPSLRHCYHHPDSLNPLLFEAMKTRSEIPPQDLWFQLFF